MSRQMRPWGFTLIEVVVVIALISILGAVGGNIFRDQLRDWRLKDAANQLLEEIREAQSQAMKLGDFATLTVGTGRQFRQQAVFLVVNVDDRSYTAWQWIDHNNNGAPEAAPNDALVQLFTRDLPEGVNFNSGPATTTACSGSAAINPSGSHSVTFDTKSYPPCAGEHCLHFDAQGTINDLGNLYLSDGRNSWAINSLVPGYFRLCRWTGSAWN